MTLTKSDMVTNAVAACMDTYKDKSEASFNSTLTYETNLN